MGCSKCKKESNCHSCNKSTAKGCKDPCACPVQVCHPCYKVLINTCETPVESKAEPIPKCVNPEYCDDGCDEIISTNCIICPDGRTLTEVLGKTNLKGETTCQNITTWNFRTPCVEEMLPAVTRILISECIGDVEYNVNQVEILSSSVQVLWDPAAEEFYFNTLATSPVVSFTFTYTIDGTDINVVAVTVFQDCSEVPIANPPQGFPECVKCTEPLVITFERLLQNDVPATGLNLDYSLLEIVTNPAHGTLTLNNLNPDPKLWFYTYQATVGYNGPDFFEYVIYHEDSVGGPSNTVRVNLSVVCLPEITSSEICLT